VEPVETYGHFTPGAARSLTGKMGTRPSNDEAYALDIETLVGEACMLNVMHKPNFKGDGLTDEVSTAVLPKVVECPAQVNPSQILTYEKWNDEIFGALPEWMKKEMEASPEFARMVTQEDEPMIADKEEVSVNDIPF
jgi:hypothetical protein